MSLVRPPHPPVMDDYGGADLGQSERNRRADAA
jgi:hypothetical protein